MRTKEKISISLDSLILEKIDSMVKRGEAKNRSQAIESILQASLLDDRLTALILAGGGKRAFRDGELKTLHVVRRKPILLHIVERLENAGVQDVWVAADEKERIRNVWEDAKFFDDEKKGTAPLVRDFIRKFGRAIVVSGDVLFEMDIRRMLKFHLHSGKLATMAVTTTKREKSKDAILVEGSEIIKFSYQPKERTYMVNAGIVIFEKEAAEFMPSRGSLERHVYPKLAKMGELAAFHFSGRWMHVE